jgi:hypothetical protein
MRTEKLATFVLPVLGAVVVGFGNPAPALANNQSQPPVQNTVQYSSAIVDNPRLPKFIANNGMVQINLKNKDFLIAAIAATAILLQGGILVGYRLAAHEARIDRQRQLLDAAAQRPSK